MTLYSVVRSGKKKSKYEETEAEIQSSLYITQGYILLTARQIAVWKGVYVQQIS